MTLCEAPPTAAAPTGPPPDPDVVDQVFDWLIEAHAPRQVRDAVKQHFPEADLDALFEATTARLRESAKVDGELLKGFCLECYRLILGRMLAIGDLQGAKGLVDRLYKVSQER